MTSNWLDKIPSKYRRALIFLSDLGSLMLSLYLAFYLRFDGNIPAAKLALIPKLFPVLAPLRLVFFVWQGLYRGFRRYASIEELMRIFRAVSLSFLASVAGVGLIYCFADLPRSVFVIDWMLAILLIGGARFSVRALLASPLPSKNRKRVLIVGAAESLLREVQLGDLLGREPIKLNDENVAAFLRNKVIMVTGAGGSIGSELCRQIARFGPRLLVMLDQAENGLYRLDQDLLQRKIEVARVLVISDVTDANRLQEIFAQYRPQLIFHAAAHKHVPLMELNKKEAVKNNVLGTRVLAETASAFGAEKLVMISTDKAVSPTSVMGASKRLAEMLLQGLSRRSRTAFITVRFGNVLGSDGSVVPLFNEQIRRGGPLTVTHPDIERYFMTIPEAVQLVLQAAAFGNGGEIFILDMGQPIKIIDLARHLITLSGYKPDDIGIQIIGLRPGEKLYEELWTSEEKMLPTVHDKIMMAQAVAPLHELNGEVDELVGLLKNGTEEEMVALLRRLVPNFQSK